MLNNWITNKSSHNPKFYPFRWIETLSMYTMQKKPNRETMTTQTHLAQLLGEPAKNATTGRPARNIARKPTPESTKMKIFTSSTASTAISPWRKLVNMIIDTLLIYIYIYIIYGSNLLNLFNLTKTRVHLIFKYNGWCPLKSILCNAVRTADCEQNTRWTNIRPNFWVLSSSMYLSIYLSIHLYIYILYIYISVFQCSFRHCDRMISPKPCHQETMKKKIGSFHHEIWDKFYPIFSPKKSKKSPYG